MSFHQINERQGQELFFLVVKKWFRRFYDRLKKSLPGSCWVVTPMYPRTKCVRRNVEVMGCLADRIDWEKSKIAPSVQGELWRTRHSRFLRRESSRFVKRRTGAFST